MNFSTETGCLSFWTAGQRIIPGQKSDFVWKPEPGVTLLLGPAPFWIPGQPDYAKNEEDCIELSVSHNFYWNDNLCTKSMCVLCQVRFGMEF